MKKIALIFGIGLVTLVSCPQPVTSENSLKTVSGTVVEDATPAGGLSLVTKAWTGGAGSVMGAYAVNAAPSPVKLGTLSANGSFTATLPTSVDSALLSGFSGGDLVDAGCTGNFTVSDKTAKTVALALSVDANQDGSIIPILLNAQVNDAAQTGTLTYQAGVLFYADRALSVTGKENCTSTYEGMPVSGQLTSSLNLAKGWNLVTVTETLTLASGKVTDAMTLASGSLPTDKWLFNATPLAQASTSGQLTRFPKPQALERLNHFIH